MDYIIYSIPIFFILIGVELIISRIKGAQLYRFHDAVTNISCGVVQQVTGAFLKTILIVGYIYLYEQYRMWDVENSVLSYAILFIAVDFFYYWFHRMAHEVNIFWGTHIVHHQSEDYNFSVALRQSSLQALVSTSFYLPLAILGFHPAAFVTISSFQTLYQFWIHTKTIDKLPRWVEYIFNTPSHHRVHHGRNPEYIDKNHGGTLIIFDRMFGTFQPEVAPVVYGVTKSLDSWNPIWANMDYYADLREDWKRIPSWGDRARLLLQKPGWLPESMGGYRAPKAVVRGEEIRYDTTVNKWMNIYALFQYVLILGLASWFLFEMTSLVRYVQLGFSLWILWSLVHIGALFEQTRWVRWAEPVRLVLYPLFALVIPVFDGTIGWIAMAAVTVLSLYIFAKARSSEA